MLKQVLGILLLHIPIAFPSVFSPTLYLHMFFLFLFPHLLTMSFPPCLQHSSSSFYYSPGPPLPDPSPPTQNMIQSSHYQEKKKKTTGPRGLLFTCGANKKNQVLLTLSDSNKNKDQTNGIPFCPTILYFWFWPRFQMNRYSAQF